MKTTLVPSSRADSRHGLCQLPTGIPSLDRLLLSPAPSGENGNAPGGEFGIAHNPETGFFGVIFGAAGSGKSVLALQLCCRFGFAAARPSGAAQAVFVSEESPQTVLEKIRAFGFVDDRALRRIGFDLHSAGNPECPLVVIQMPIDPAKQRLKLTAVFERLTDSMKGGMAGRKALLCIDNADILKLESMLGERQAAAGEAGAGTIYKRIRNRCAELGLNVWLTFEEQTAASQTAEEAQIATTPEAYAADVVFRLGVKVFPNGYRERSFEIVKAKHQPIRRGRHHFSIRGGTRKPPHGFVIYPSLATQLHVLGGRDGPGGEPHAASAASARDYTLGVDTVDRAVLALNSEGKAPGYIQQGTVSVLVSDLDSIASELAMHFALQDADTTLYLTTLHRAPVLQRMKAGYTAFADRVLAVKEMLPEHVSEGKLLSDLDEWIRDVQKAGIALKPGQTKSAKRVVLDNVFEWRGKFPLIRDSSHFLAALFDLFRKRDIAAFVVDMVEVGEGRNPLASSLAAGLADHVFVLRHVELRAETSKVFSVQKLASLREPQSVWELKRTPERIVAEDRLSFFKGVLCGRLEPVQINLSLFAESVGSPLDQYISTHTRILQATFGQRIQVNVSNSQDYAAFQRNVVTHYLNALGDCQVVSIDEIWLKELGTQYLEPLPVGGRLSRRFVTAGHQLAFGADSPECYAIPERNNVGVLTFDPEVATLVDIDGISPPADPASVTWFDIAKRQRAYIRWCDRTVPECRRIGFYRGWEPGFPAPALSASQEKPSAPASEPAGAHVPSPPAGVFTISMETGENCVSAYLEMVFAALDRKGHLLKRHSGILDWDAKLDLKWAQSGCKDAPDLFPSEDTAWTAALLLLLSTLTPWDLMRLAHCWYRPTNSEHRYLYSRQWFSNWGTLGLSRPGLSFHELPPGATGEPTPASGAWYFGILKGSTAINAGMKIIEQMTLAEDELHRYHRGIALPVSEIHYARTDGIIVRRPIPYRRAFAQFGRMYNRRSSDIARIAHDSRCPFYRQTIDNYNDVSRLLMGLIVRVANEAVSGKYDRWLWRTGGEPERRDYARLIAEVRRCVARTSAAYQSLADGNGIT
ncbi:hypothetical protein DB347_24655 [Opitutaceae bacterium EW11]|nr:hypothetical protein DB347_24655 [Opitutaceae bacterium EW11]